jgi:O-antigen ligase
MTIGGRRPGAAALAAAGVAAVVVLLLALNGNQLFLDRFAAAAEAGGDRAVLVQTHWQAFLRSPLTGYGLGSFPELNNQVMTPQTFPALAATTQLHNVYLQWLVEAGLLGALPMFAAVALVLWTAGRRGLQRRSGRTLVAGLLAADVVVLLHGLTDFSLQIPSIAALWALLLGLQFAWAQAPSRR